MAPRPESGSEGLQASLAAIFDQAQTSLANHRKNCVALYKIHVRASVGDKKSRKEKPDQAEFIAAFLDMVSRVVSVKKGPATVDRIIKFVAQYVRFVNEKALEDKAKRQPEVPTHSISSGSVDGDEDTLASVFISSILEWVIQGFLAKNKVVRYQTVHLVAEMISFLGEIDEDSYLALRESLIERSTCDKEPTIRAQAVSALARLIGSEDPNELQDGEKSILEVLLDVLTLDPAADVRRAALVHIPLNAATLPSLLPRSRDVDPLTRKLLYTSVLIPRLDHPRHLSVAQRETLVQTGLGDREPTVRLAAGKMVAAWFGVVQGEQPESDLQEGAVSWTGDDGGIMRALVAFLALFDVVGPGEAVAVDALLALLTTHTNLFDGFVFEDAYWHNLTPESAVLARAFLEHCLGSANPNSSYSGAGRGGGRGEERLEAASLPVVTAFAFHVQEAYNALLVALEDAEVVRTLALSAGPRGLDNEDEDDEAEEELAKREVVLGELLRMAVKLDYGDEIGRRKVYTVTRDMLAHPQLPPSLIERCLDVLKEIMPTERELIRVVVEVVMDLREPAGEEEPDHDTTIRSDSPTRKERSLRRAKARDEMTAEDGARADLTDLRCLAVTIGMLERVHGNFEDNSTLEGILADLIIPAVRRKELGIREKGLVGLGLCCLIAKSIAVKSLQLFLSQIQNAPEQLKFKLLQIVFDLMVMYDQQLWGRVEDGQAILTFLADTLEAEESPMVQAVLCVGLAKLLLAGLADDPKILKTLLMAYVSPHTAGNAELRQCLSYFFSVYCYSSAQNQSRVQSIFIPAFEEVARMHDEEAGEGQTMVTPQQFGLLVIDWTDARKAAESTTPTPSRHVHADLAVDILLALYDSDKRSSDQEVLCTLLNHLHIVGTLTSPVLVKLSVLLQHIQTQCPFDDPALDKAVSRFKNRFTADFEAELAEVDWAEYGTPEMSEVYNFIGIDVPDTDARDGAGSPRPESPVPAKTRKEKPKPAKMSRSKPAREASEESGQSSDESDDEVAPPDSPVPTRQTSTKRSQLKAATPDAEENDSAEEDVAMVLSPPPKPKAKAPATRKSRSKPVPEPEEIEMRPKEEAPEDEEAPDDAKTAPSPPPKPKAKVPARRSRSKAAPESEPEEMEEDGMADESRSPSAPPKTKAKGRRSRSKAAPEEEEEAPSSVPVAKASKAKASARRSRSKAAPEENEVPNEDAAPAPVPVPKASKANAPARQSRSKAALAENEVPEDEAPSSVPVPRPSRAKAPPRKSRSKATAEEEEVPGAEAPSSVPVTKPSKVKVPARRSRSKAAPAQESDPGPEEDNVAGPSTVPPRRASRQTRASAAPPPPEDAEPALDSDDEDAAPPVGPVTPPKTQSGRKRVRTPSAKLALPSPADKKRRKPAVPPVAPAPPVPMRGTRSSSRRKPPPDIPIASDDDFGGYSES